MLNWQLFLAFFRVGIFGYGGGPSMIPLVHTECVQKYKWISSEEFADYYALANTLPGPIATKMAAYVGYKLKGWLGALIAISAVSLPLVVVMILLLQIISSFKDLESVQHMISAIQPVIGIMMIAITWEFLTKGWKSAKIKVSFVGLVLLSVTLLLVLNLHPGILIVILLTVAFFYSTWLTNKHKASGRRGADS